MHSLDVQPRAQHVANAALFADPASAGPGTSMQVAPLVPSPGAGPVAPPAPRCRYGALAALDVGDAVVSGYWLGGGGGGDRDGGGDGSGGGACCGVTVAGQPSAAGHAWTVSAGRPAGVGKTAVLRGCCG